MNESKQSCRSDIENSHRRKYEYYNDGLEFEEFNGFDNDGWKELINYVPDVCYIFYVHIY